EPGRRVAGVGDDHVGRRPRAEQRLAQRRLRGGHFVRELFVDRKSFDQLENQWHVALGGALDADGRLSHRIRFPSAEVLITLSSRRTRVSGSRPSITYHVISRRYPGGCVEKNAHAAVSALKIR